MEIKTMITTRLFLGGQVWLNRKLHRLIFLFCFGILSFDLSAQTVHNSFQNLQEIETVRSGQFSELPSFIKFKTGHEIDISNFVNWIKSNLIVNANIDLQLLRSEMDNLGHEHFRFQQTYFGKPIEDAIWIAHTKNNNVYSCNGLLYSTIFSQNTTLISEETALTKALDFVQASVYKWELIGEETHLRWEKSDSSATYFPAGELVYVCSSKNYENKVFHLAYKFNIYAHQPLYRALIYVDANSGEIIRENLLVHHADAPGTAHTIYSGPQVIMADSFGGSYRLRDASRGNGIRTFDLNNSSDYMDAVDFEDADNNWNNINVQKDEYATDAHWGAEMTYDYYFQTYSRNSIDNAGYQLNNYVHYWIDFADAFWDGDRMTYGDGVGAITPLTSLEIVAHEITHGLTNFTANLLYFGESGALNESFSDIFGTAIEEFARPSNWDWEFGTETGMTVRSLSNPNLYACPDTYKGDFWIDGGDVHTNSSVQNHWYYLLTTGGTGTNDIGNMYTVNALGIDEASAIAFRNLTVYLTPSSNYADARFYSILAAEDLYGTCSNQVEQTINAWYAVGVGLPYTPNVIANFDADNTLGCSLPFEVTFQNQSINADNFLWDFGDGSTSTAENPTHSYLTEGVFNISLFVNGEACIGGNDEDELTVNGFVSIDLDGDCPFIFPTNGQGAPITTCQGTLYDSGGPNGNYGTNELATQTISPVGASSVVLNFIEFDVQGYDWAGGCTYDILFIYEDQTIPPHLLELIVMTFLLPQ